eukprot:gene4997-6366_t
MSSEALLENPKLFSPLGDYNFRNKYVTSQLETVDQYLDILNSFPAPRPVLPVVRGHMFRFLFRFLDAPNGLDLRERMQYASVEDMSRIVDEIKTRLLPTYEDDQEAVAAGLLSSRTWYGRHRGEEEQARIHSRRRAFSKIRGPPKLARTEGMTSSEETEATLATRLEDLKARLLEKRRTSASIMSE